MRIQFIAGMLLTVALGTSLASAQGAGKCEEFLSMFSQTSPKRDVDPAELAKSPLGSARNPVRAEMPYGERAYLAKLVCENGARPTEVARIGSMGAGPDGHIVDAYTAKCAGKMIHVYMDMYHCGYVENRAVPGFRIRSRNSQEL
jgi:hypothetical protein